MGRRAGKMMLDQAVLGKTSDRQVLLESELVIRASCAPAQCHSHVHQTK